MSYIWTIMFNPMFTQLRNCGKYKLSPKSFYIPSNHSNHYRGQVCACFMSTVAFKSQLKSQLKWFKRIICLLTTTVRELFTKPFFYKLVWMNFSQLLNEDFISWQVRILTLFILMIVHYVYWILISQVSYSLYPDAHFVLWTGGAADQTATLN